MADFWYHHGDWTYKLASAPLADRADDLRAPVAPALPEAAHALATIRALPAEKKVRVELEGAEGSRVGGESKTSRPRGVLNTIWGALGSV